MRMTSAMKAALVAAAALMSSACGDDRPPVNGNGTYPTYPAENPQGNDGYHPQMPVTE